MALFTASEAVQRSAESLGRWDMDLFITDGHWLPDTWGTADVWRRGEIWDGRWDVFGMHQKGMHQFNRSSLIKRMAQFLKR